MLLGRTKAARTKRYTYQRRTARMKITVEFFLHLPVKIEGYLQWSVQAAANVSLAVS